MANTASGTRDRKRKVRTGATHLTREEWRRRHSAAFSRRVLLATTHIVEGSGEERRIVERALGKSRDVSELVLRPHAAPWCLPRIVGTRDHAA